MHVHVLGIGGTFMGGIAQLARAGGDRVTGADAKLYPPMSDQLAQAGIDVIEGWDPTQLEPAPDLVVIGNALSRGNPAVEAVLDRDLPYTSGPAWLRDRVLRERHVLAVAGTHGKTTTASMLVHLLEVAGLEPGYLIGGVPLGQGVSARLGTGAPFVVEADEYDTAFFDKRSKFVHYAPRTLVMTNMEFDHADIFDDLAAIERQFHYLVRTVPGRGRLLARAGDAALARVLARGYWTPRQHFSTDGDAAADWRARDVAADGGAFSVEGPDGTGGRVEWPLIGEHNVANGVAAVAAAEHVGVDPATACRALADFAGVRRRLELCGSPRGIHVYDDFAHHPTAIRLTLEGLRRRVGGARILAALDLAANTMRQGVHANALAEALAGADRVVLHAAGELDWDPAALAGRLGRERAVVLRDAAAVTETLAVDAEPGDHVVVMSNSGFGGLPGRLVQWLDNAVDGTNDAT